MDYYKKYIKYKTKYTELKIDIEELNIIDQSYLKQTGGGNKYICNPNNNFEEICLKETNGYYNSKEKCQNDCEIKFINRHLIEGKIKHEANQFNLFIQDLMKENIDIYIKGGTVLGLKVLKMIYDKYPGASFEKHFNEFLKLNLIRDWDFAGYTKDKKITEDYRNKLDKIAKKYNLVPRAKTFILYQAKFPIKMDDQALFEIAILENDNFIGLELPATTMKVKINRRNLFYVFMLAKYFYSYKIKNTPIDLNVIKYLIKDMNIIIPKHKKGLFIFDKLYRGNLSTQLIYLISEFTNDITLQQFLVTHLQEPHRLTFRLVEKNIPKTNKILIFLEENNLEKHPNWLFDPKYITKQTELFIEKLGSKIYKIYINGINKKLSKETILDEILDLLEGINLSRLQIEYKNFTCRGKDLIKTLFERVATDLLKNKEELDDIKENKLMSLFLFFDKQGLFTESDDS